VALFDCRLGDNVQTAVKLRMFVCKLDDDRVEWCGVDSKSCIVAGFTFYYFNIR